MKFFTSWKFVPVHLLLVLLISTAFVLYFFKVYLPSSTLHGEEIQVPKLGNMDLEEAQKLLEEKQLNFVISDTTYSDKHNENSVVNQLPKAGEAVKRGRKIYVTINSPNPPPVALTDKDIEGIKIGGEAELSKMLNAFKLKKGIKIKDTVIDYFSGGGYIFELQYEDEALQPGVEIPRWAKIDYITVKGGGTELKDSTDSGLADSLQLDLLQNEL